MKNKHRVIVGIIVFIIAVITSIVSIMNRNERIKAENMVRAEEIRTQLLGCTFEGESRSTSTVDKGGSIKLSSFTDTNILCKINSSGEVIITETKSYCDGTAIITNGKMLYDDVDVTEKKHKLGEVEISLSGNVEVKIGSEKYSLIVDKEGKIVQIVIHGILCNLK